MFSMPHPRRFARLMARQGGPVSAGAVRWVVSVCTLTVLAVPAWSQDRALEVEGSTALREVLPPVPDGPPGLSAGPAFAPSSDSRDIRWLLVSQNAQKALWHNLLGARRVRELERARFEMHLNDLHHDREMREDEDYFRDMSESVGRAVGKVMRERLERRLDLDSTLRRSRGGGGGGGGAVQSGYRFSPRVDLGSRNRLGVKMSFREAHESTWRSRLTFQASHDFEEDLYLKLVYNGRRAEAELRFVGDDEDFGQTVIFDYRMGLGRGRIPRASR